MKKIYLLLGMTVFSCRLAFAQGVLADLLYKLEQVEGEKKVEILFEIGGIYQKKEPKKAVLYLQNALTEAERQKDKTLIISAYFKLIEATKEQYNYTITYKAEKGEFVADICKRFGITRSELEKHNYLSKDREILSYSGRSFEISSSLSYIQPIVYRQVCQYYNEVLRLRRQQANKTYLIFTLKKIGDFYAEEDKFEKAETYYLEWLRLRREEDSKTKLVWVLRYLADFYRKSEQLEKAKTFYEEIISIDKARKDDNDYANTLAQISLIYPEPLQAEKYFHQALRIWLKEKNYAKINWMRDRELYEQFDAYIPQKDAKEKYLLERLEMTKISADTVLMYRAYKRLVYFYLPNKWQVYKAEKYLDSLWRFAKTKNITKLLNYKDNILDRVGIYAVAYANEKYIGEGLVAYLHTFRKYYEVIDAKNNQDFLSDHTFTVYTYLESYYKQVEKYDSAAYFFKKRMRINEQTTYVEHLDDLAFLYQKGHHYKKALHYFEKALRLQESKKNPILIAEQFNKIGYLYEQKLEPKQMTKYYKKALKILKRLDPQDIRAKEENSKKVVGQLKRIAALYENQGKIKTAISFAQKIVDIYTILYGKNQSRTYEQEQYVEILKSQN